MIGQLLRGRPLRVGVVGAMVAGLLAVGSGVAPTGAQTVTKALSASCTGTDPESVSLVSVLGGSSLDLPFEVVSDVPATLAPEESGSPISFAWRVSLAPDVVDKAVLVDPQLTISNLVLDMGVKGPTSTTEVQGRPGTLNLDLVKGQPASVEVGPFTGTLNDVGKGGLIRYAPKAVSLTIAVDLNGQPKLVNVACQVAGNVATTTVKIPGSPEITQPINVDAQPGQTVSVDVLGQFVKAGVDEEGVTRPVDPSTLKVIEGPGTVVDGKVQATAGGPGTTTSVAFEVCSGVLPGANEVQRLVIDPSNYAGRRSVGFTLTQGDAEGDPVWLARKWAEFPFGGNLEGNIFNALFVGILDQYRDDLDSNGDGTADYPATFPKPGDWRSESFAYFFTEPLVPTVAQIDAAVEALPGVGAGGVEVTAVDGEPFSFDITFVGANAQKDVPSLGIGEYYSILPRETLQLILDQASALLGGGGGGEGGEPGPTTTLPDGVGTIQEYGDLLVEQLNAALAAGNIELAQQKLSELVGILPDLLLSNLDVDAIISFITSLFPSPPSVTTTTAGEDPTPICSQGVVDVTTASVAAAVVVAPQQPAVAGTTREVPISFAG